MSLEPSASPVAPPASAGADDPRLWLSTRPLLDLEDPKLRLRAQSLTQLCKTEREKALALYGFVKRIPYAKPFKRRLRTAREVLEAHQGDAIDKATLLVALMRLAGVPARMRWVELHGELLRGLTSGIRSAARPLVEAWLGGRWVHTDTFIFDAAYMAAARERLRENGWTRGYGIHVQGQTLWDGVECAYAGALPLDRDPMVLQDLGVWNDALEFVQSRAYRDKHPRVARTLQWYLASPGIERGIRELREGGQGGEPPLGARKTVP